jgi:hypothetical protein
MKPFHHIIDYASIKVGGTPVNRNSQWNNFYINEILKRMNTDEYRIIGDLLNYNIDSSESLKTTAATPVIEYNNNLVVQTGLKKGITPDSYRNVGHYDRILRLNQDLSNGNLKASGTTTTTLANNYQSCYLGTTINNTATSNFPVSTAAAPTILTWTYNCIVPLSKIHDFFSKIPSINSTQGFELRLQTNVGSPAQNYWTQSFSTGGAVALANSFSQSSAATPLTGFTCGAVQSFGHTCPFMISPVNVSGTTQTNAGTGLAVFPLNSTAAPNNNSNRVIYYWL